MMLSDTEDCPSQENDAESNTSTLTDNETAEETKTMKVTRKRNLKNRKNVAIQQPVKHVNIDSELDRKLLHVWTATSSTTGYCTTLSNVDDVVKILQEHTRTRFCSLKQAKSFGTLSIKDGFRVWFDEKSDSKTACVIPYDGVPYVFLGKKVLMCSLGPDKHKVVKKRLKEKYHQAVNDPSCAKKPRMCRGTKKRDCTARIVIKEVMKFPQHGLSEDTPRLRKSKSDLVKSAIKDDPECGEKRFYLLIPEKSEHDKYHAPGAGIRDKKTKVVKKRKVNIKKLQTRILEKMSLMTKLTSLCHEEVALKQIETLIDTVKSTLDENNIHEELLEVPGCLEPGGVPGNLTHVNTAPGEGQQSLVLVESQPPRGAMQQDNEIHFKIECAPGHKINKHQKKMLQPNSHPTLQTFPVQQSNVLETLNHITTNNHGIQQPSITVSHENLLPTQSNQQSLVNSGNLPGQLCTVGGATQLAQPITLLHAGHVTQTIEQMNGIGQAANIITANNQLNCNDYTVVNQWTNQVNIFNPGPTQQQW